jgi:alkylation response protein AidB-like acyl-CoA dehydrogenase
VDLTLNEAEAAFRDEVRAWLEANHPGPEPHGDQEAFAFRREWQRKLHEGGWAGISWPTEFGGRGATLIEQAIFSDEMARADAPAPANVLGLVMGGPVIMAHGTDEQKERWLEPILSGEEIWCQGFSEPESGSDLASLKTRAVEDPETGEWVVTGQKVWTSGAQFAKWCMLVARTDPDAPRKHQGLTYFVLDMEQPGVQVVPLRQITGESEFNELFLQEARIPAENVVGGVGNGWKVAMTTLMNERSGLAFFLQVRLRQQLDKLIAEADRRGRLEDPVIVERIGELHVRTEVLRLTAYRGLTAIEKHGQPGPEGSLTKWMWSDTNQQLTQFAVDVLGDEALTRESPWSFELLRARGNSIEGGTTEILKNIVAERVLGLPRMR